MGRHKKFTVICHSLITPFSSWMNYEAAYCEEVSQMRAVVKLMQWYAKRIAACEIPNCSCKESTMTIASEMNPELKAAGAYDNMVEIF